jgi:hypothetical protein
MYPLAILVLENNNYISYSINMDWSHYNGNGNDSGNGNGSGNGNDSGNGNGSGNGNDSGNGNGGGNCKGEAYNEFIERLYKHIQLDHDKNTCIHGVVHEVYVTFNDMPVNSRTDNIQFFVYNHEHCKNYKPVCNNMPIRFLGENISDDCINYDSGTSDSIITYNKVTCKHITCVS